MDDPPDLEEGGDLGPDDLLEALKGSYRGETKLERVRLGQILRSGLLVGQPVQYRAADGRGIHITGIHPPPPSPPPDLFHCRGSAHYGWQTTFCESSRLSCSGRAAIPTCIQCVNYHSGYGVSALSGHERGVWTPQICWTAKSTHSATVCCHRGLQIRCATC